MTRIMPPMPKPPSLARQRGLALIVVLWAAILLALIAGGVARLSRADLNLARNLVEATKAELAADSALWTAVHAIVNGGPDAWRTDGTVYAWRFGEAEVRVRVTDELGRIDINAASPELLAALFVAAGTAPEEATALADAVVEFRNRGVEDPEILNTGRLSVGPDAAFALTDGLAQVPGMPPALQNRIAAAITVYTGQARPRRGVASQRGREEKEGGKKGRGEEGEGGKERKKEGKKGGERGGGKGRGKKGERRKGGRREGKREGRREEEKGKGGGERGKKERKKEEKGGWIERR